MTPTKAPATAAEPQVSAESRDRRRLEALDRANRTRSRRARLRADLRLGQIQPQVIINKPPEWMETATVEWVLLASPRIGPTTANRILNQLKISPTRPLGRLSPQERNDLVIAIVQKGWRK